MRYREDPERDKKALEFSTKILDIYLNKLTKEVGRFHIDGMSPAEFIIHLVISSFNRGYEEGFIRSEWIDPNKEEPPKDKIILAIVCHKGILDLTSIFWSKYHNSWVTRIGNIRINKIIYWKETSSAGHELGVSEICQK